MEEIRVSLPIEKEGAPSRTFERFYLSTMKYRLWRFFILPVVVFIVLPKLWGTPMGWMIAGFTAAWVMLWIKSYLKFCYRLKMDDQQIDAEVVEFVANKKGFGIIHEGELELIPWSDISRFAESRNLLAFAGSYIPTITFAKEHFSKDEISFLRNQTRSL